MSGQDSTYYTYNKLIQNATELVELEQYGEALKYYDDAFEQIGFVPYHYYDAFEAAVNDSNYIKANQYLHNGTLNGLDLNYWTSDEIDVYNKSGHSGNFWRSQDSLLNIHLNSIDIDYFNSLQILKDLDQADRSGSAESQLRDSLNFDELILLSKEKGFPTFEKTGYGFNKAWILLWHQRGDKYPNSTQWQMIIPLIHEEIKNGQVDPQFFKVFDDFNQKKK